MKKDYKGKIKNIESITSDTFKLEILSSLNSAHSGQFISVLCPNKILRRPFSISDFKKTDDGSITTILFKLKGGGTLFLKSLKIGDEIQFLAPLGNGFKIEENKNSLLVGAGIGIAPMLFLKKELDEKKIKNYLISGFRAESEVIKGSDRTIVGGSVIDYLEEIIKEKDIKIVYACGPNIVLKLISELCNKLNITSKLAMEKVMACGIGVCRGCVIKLKKENKETMASVCKDGPVFLGDEIIWE